MLISNHLEFRQKPDHVYGLLLDLDSVGLCIPGAKLGPADETQAREATIDVRFGPMRFQYAGKLKIVENDPSKRRAVFATEARETSGEGTARSTIVMTVNESELGAHVAIETELHVTGAVAQMGQGMIEEFAQELMDQFSACMEIRIQGGESGRGDQKQATVSAAKGAAAGPVNALTLLLRVLWRRIARLFGRRRS